jgi:hypothetical protein
MTRKRDLLRGRIVCVYLLIILCNAVTVRGQSQITTGAIQGTVSDPTGAVIPKATVVLKHKMTGVERTVLTDEAGRFTAPLLQVGEYEITVSAPGFSQITRPGYNLNLGETLVANLEIAVAGISSEVGVTAEVPLVEVTRSETSTLVDERAVENLPLNGRRFLDLAFLTPGVIQEPERNQLSFAGQRGINSNINVDGADFNQPFFGGQRGGERTSDAYVVSQEAIREFQVVRSGFAPEFGRSTGGVVNVITKSGSNDIHGSAFYYLRHREFAPRTVFGDDVAPIRQQFGGTVGGPIKRDKSFYFMAYDQQAQHQALIIRYNNIEGLPSNFLAQQGKFKSTNDVNTYLVKADHEINSKNHLTVRYNYSRNHALNGTFTGVTTGTLDNNGTEKDGTHTAVGNLNTIFSPTLLNELRGQYSYETRPRINNNETSDFNPTAGPQVQITGCCFFGGVSFLPAPEHDDRIQLADNVSYVVRGHSIKVGFDYNRSHVKQIFRGNWRGVYVFNNIGNFVNSLNKLPGTAPDQFRVFFGDGRFNTSVNEAAGFFQDTWKVGQYITISGGLRYEATMNPTPPKPNPLLPQTSTIPSDKQQWQPRLGVTLDFFGDGSLVLRGSGGIFYARTPMLLMSQAFNANGNPDVGIAFTLNPTQYLQAQSVHPELVFPFVPDSSIAANASFFTGAGIAGLKPDASFFDPHFRNPRSYNINLGAEYLVSPNLAIALDWVSTNTVHLERIHDVNLFPPTLDLDSSSPPQLRPLYNVSVRPNPNFNILRNQESSAHSNYNGFTFSVNKRYSKRYQFMGSYTLGYNRDDDSNERNFAGIAYSDAFNLVQDYRWSRIDIRQRGVLSGTYSAPFGLTLSGIVSYRSGLPFSAFTNADSNRDSQFNDKPIINGIPLLRNSFRQPNYFNIDSRVARNFAVREGHVLAVMFEMFNLTNQRNFTYAVSTNESTTTALGSQWGTGQTPLPTFRAIRLPDGSLNQRGINVGSPFQLQVALKYNF